MLAAGMHRLYGGRVEERTAKGGKANDPLSMFDRAADIRCFGNITRKGGPAMLLFVPRKLFCACEDRTRERNPSETIWREGAMLS